MSIFKILTIILKVITQNNKPVLRSVEEYHTVPLTMAFAESTERFQKQFTVSDFAVFGHQVNKTTCPGAKEMIDEIVDHGYKKDNKVFKPIFISAGENRKGEFALINEKVKKNFLEWALLGFPIEKYSAKLAPNKLAKYLGLYFSHVRPWDEIWHGDELLSEALPKPDFNEVAVLDDVKVSCPGLFDVIKDNKVIRKFVEDHENVISDGNGIYILDEKKLNCAQRRALKRALRTFTFRAPWMKGYLTIVFKGALEAYCKKMGTSIVKDFWNNEVDLLQKKIITFKTVFKAAKCFDSYEEYADACVKYGHTFWVCVEDHGERLNGIPYQQVQTCQLTDEELARLVNKTAGELKESVETGGIKDFMKNKLGKAVTLYPSMLQHPVIWNNVQMAYSKQRMRMAGGRLPNMAHNLFCAIDPLALLDGIFGQPVKGFIPENCVVTHVYNASTKEKEVLLDCTRNPHLDHAHAIRRNIHVPSWYDGLYLGRGIFYSAHDNTMVLHQMDFDGDHSNVTNNPDVIRAALRGIDKYENVPYLYDADDTSSSIKADYWSALSDMCRNAEAAPIGVFVNTLTKVWASGRYDSTRIGLLTQAANGQIDTQKNNGAGNVSGARNIVFQMRGHLKPYFLRYAKGRVDQENPTNLILPDEEEYDVYRSSSIDKMSALVRLQLPADMRELINPEKDYPAFDQHMLYCNPNRQGAVRVTGLIRDGQSEEELGIWNKLCLKTAAELKEIEQHNSLAAMPDYNDMVRQTIRSELKKFYEKDGYTEEDIIDALIYALFYRIQRTDKLAPSMIRVFFIVYGDRIVDNLHANLGLAVTKEEDAQKDDDEEAALFGDDGYAAMYAPSKDDEYDDVDDGCDD